MNMEGRKNKIIVLSEIELPDLDNRFEVQELKYGNRLLNYLSDKKKQMVIADMVKPGVEAIVCCRASAKIISNLKKTDLKIIQLTSTGFDGVPVDRIKNKGIAIANARDIYDISISETVVYAVLKMAKRLRKNPQLFRPKLLRNYSNITELYGKRVIVLGTGSIGTAIAQRLIGFDMLVDGYDIKSDLNKPFKELIHTKEDLLSRLNQYDYVISTLPANETTEKFCDELFFDNMSKSGVFFNVGRNATVDSNAIYKALKRQTIGGAIFDDVELLPISIFNKYRRLKNTLILPGIATGSEESKIRVKERIEKNITDFFETESCQDIL